MSTLTLEKQPLLFDLNLPTLIQAITQLPLQEQLDLIDIMLQSVRQKMNGAVINQKPNIPGLGEGADLWTEEEFIDFQDFLAQSRSHVTSRY